MARKDEGPGGVKLNRLTGLVKRIDAAKARSDDARSDLGNLYKEAEDQLFNRQELKMAIKLRNMEPDKRNDYLTSLQAYCDYLGVWSQASMFPEPGIPSAEASAGAGAEQGAGAAEDPPAAEVGGFNYQRGRDDALAGKTIDENPWAVGIRAHDSWEAGWRDQTQVAADGLEPQPPQGEADPVEHQVEDHQHERGGRRVPRRASGNGEDHQSAAE